MANVCKVHFIGRLARTPVRVLVRGITKVEFVLVYNPRWYVPETGEVDESPVFIDCIAYNKPGGRPLAEHILEMQRGDQHYFEGRIVCQKIDESVGLYLLVDSFDYLTDSRHIR